MDDELDQLEDVFDMVMPDVLSALSTSFIIPHISGALQLFESLCTAASTSTSCSVGCEQSTECNSRPGAELDDEGRLKLLIVMGHY